MEVEKIAKICHEANRAYCEALGDNTQPHWELAPQWQKDSAMAGVKLHAEKPDTTPEGSHESWLAQKIADGWVYGPKKDPVLKEHPCIVPYCNLPKEQQTKDSLFSAIVKALI
jgi:hypothetical protein